MFVYKKTDKSYIELQQGTTSVTTSNNEWQQMTTNGATSDKEWQRMIASGHFD